MTTPGQAGRPLAKSGAAKRVSGCSDGQQQSLDMRRGHPAQRLGVVDEPLVVQLQRQSHRRLRRPLRRPRLQQPQFAVLDGELDLLHVGREPLQAAGGVRSARRRRAGCSSRRAADRFHVDQSRHHVVALAAGQPFAERLVGAGDRVARKERSGTGIGAVVAEHHGLHHHRGAAPIVRGRSGRGRQPREASSTRRTPPRCPRATARRDRRERARSATRRCADTWR